MDSDTCKDCGVILCPGCVEITEEEVSRCKHCHEIATEDDREPEEHDMLAESYAADVAHWAGME